MTAPRPLCSIALAGAALLLARCDIAPLPGAVAPSLATTSIEPGARGYAEHPVDEPIELVFDRPLWPRSINRGTVTVQSGEVSLVPRVNYEPTRRAVVLTVDRASVRFDLEYVLSIREGISSWDGATALGLASRRVRFVDRVSSAEPPVSLRGEIAPALRSACATSGCHSAQDRTMGLDLSSPEGILQTTVSRRSREWEASSAGAEFYWGGMNLVEPGAPGESFLVYKLLGEGPMRGAQMPRGAAALDRSVAARISAWIAQGARDDR